MAFALRWTLLFICASISGKAMRLIEDQLLPSQPAMRIMEDMGKAHTVPSPSLAQISHEFLARARSMPTWRLGQYFPIVAFILCVFTLFCLCTGLVFVVCTCISQPTPSSGGSDDFANLMYDPSIPNAPSVILPDPAFDEFCVFCVRALSIWDKNYLVMQGANNDIHRRWFVIRKTGQTGDVTIDLENFHRKPQQDKDPDEASEERGEIMYSARFASEATFQNQIRPPETAAPIAFTSFMTATDATYAVDDWHYVELANRHGGQRLADRVLICKWAMQTKVTIMPQKRTGSHAGGKGSMVLNVFITGTTVRSYSWLLGVPSTQNQGTIVDNCHHVDDKYIDAIDYQLMLPDGQSAAMWRVAGDVEGNGQQLFVDSPLFSLAKKGGWSALQSEKTISTKPAFDPLLGLLVGHICETEFCVRVLKDRHEAKFPDKLFQPIEVI